MLLILLHQPLIAWLLEYENVGLLIRFQISVLQIVYVMFMILPTSGFSSFAHIRLDFYGKCLFAKLRCVVKCCSPFSVKRWFPVRTARYQHPNACLWVSFDGIRITSMISRGELKNWTFWLVEKLIIWRYMHPTRAWLLSSGGGLSASIAYPWVFTVIYKVVIGQLAVKLQLHVAII